LPSLLPPAPNFSLCHTLINCSLNQENQKKQTANATSANGGQMERGKICDELGLVSESWQAF
jgi:hypothetical protein